MLFLPHRGNKVNKWYTICICILELLLTTYAFCYNFKLDDPLIQLSEDYKWIIFFLFLLETGNRWTFYRNDFTDRIYYYFSYFSGFSSYSGFPIILFPDVSNVQRPNRIIFFSGYFTFFHHVGIRINSRLSPFIHVGWKETFVFSYKIYFIHCRKFYFFINRSFRYKFIWFERTNIKFRTIRESSLSCHTRNTILYWISYCFCRQITDYTFTYLVN
uniref:Uncharacterized protein n=1 Tax=Brassica oleracea TaxID=3712 RepID=A0A3P6E8B2_BRAOL|nr:unnamed protein product [Brassica oleracea]